MNTELAASVLAPDNYSYKERDLRAPKVEEGEMILIDEPGRVFDRVDYRSHYFRVTKPEHGDYTLRVHHGAGEESWRLGYKKPVIEGLLQLDSDTRFLMLWTIMDAHHRSATKTAERLNAEWQKAAAEKRIRTRKIRGENRVKVWIEPKS